MKAQGWGSKGSCYTLVVIDDMGNPSPDKLREQKILMDDDLLCWEVDVDSVMEAMILYHQYQNWEPYSPMDDDKDEYLEALKKLKLDNDDRYTKKLGF